ncbi:putative uncharacterized protein DDB_G0282133 isoform X1 [Aphidius gifuensis]|uniref:putative uncharacterized protein DDB_G0282133 isoform X1 n=1 Tax=Aphidius gifuensis TaxID=684658 RepID=UPI001CDD249F|nr:putative uncharacterized protein DDB_G0282133 isoform X1 [Aphidius gifuensis]
MEVKKISEINDQQMSNDVGIITGQCDKSIENIINNNDDNSLENIQNESSTCPNKETPNDVKNKKDIIINTTDNDHQDDTTESIDKLNSVAGAQSPTALAFTIDFSDEKKDKNDTAKYQNLFQRFNARHRRNFSTSQLEVKNSKSSNDLSPNFIQKKKPMSINSEGYFSSEDDTKRKVDRLSKKLQELGLKTNTKGAIKKTDIMTRSLTENKSIIKRRSYCDDDDEEEEQQQQKTSNKIRPEMTYSATMNDLSRIQKLNSSIEDNERSNCVKYSPEKIYTKNIEYININHEYNNDKIIQNVKLTNINYLSDNDDNNIKRKIKKKKHTNTQIMSVSFTSEHVSNSSTSNKNLDVFNVSNIDDNSDDTISETGTYTIHKDYTDEEKARMDIDKEFSVGILTEDEKKNNELYINNKFNMRCTHDNNTWIKEWATQVAVHNLVPKNDVLNDGRTTPSSPTKIPSPIYSNSRRQSKSRYEQSDSSLDADIQQKCGLNNSNNNIIDSGGESDDDTSNSYPTPPLTSQRTSTHSTLVRRGSLTEALFKRVNNNDGRRSMRKYQDEITFDIPKSPSHVLARMKVERCNSLDRKDHYSDTQESNSSRRSSIRNDDNNIIKHTNSPILNRLKLTTSKLTNSPIFDNKKITKNNIKSPSFDCQKKFTNYDNNKSKNIDKSSYILRKSNSTSNYREIINDKNDYYHHHNYQINNSPLLQRNNSIKRSSSNNSIRNTKGLTRCDSFNDKHCEINRKIKNKISGSDSSSETGEIHRHHHQQKHQQQQQQQLHVPPISSGIKLNRAFSIRRGRLNNDSDTTSNTTTPEERRRRGQSEIKSAPTSARQQNYHHHHRERTNSAGASNKDTFKKSDILTKDKQRGPSLSRNESGRYSIRGQKLNNNINSNTQNIQSRINQKINKDNKNCGRSNSTLTSKEVEFQNWKRRKNYNPMLAASEGKKKPQDITKKNIDDTTNDCRDNSVLRSASFHGTRGTLSLAGDDWSDNDNNFNDSNEILQIPPPSSPLDGSDSDLDTSSYLQTTHNVVTAMSARMNVYHHSNEPVDSGGESDDDTSHSLRNNNNKIHNQVSDTESSDDQQAINSKNLTKFNRSFGIRRGREIHDTDIKIPQIKNQHNLSNNNNTRTIARTDSGRFSMRASKTNNNVNNVKGKTKEDKKKLMQQHLKEQEMQNWKRRKSYNPMQAAMMDAKRKTSMAKKNLNESSSVLRSQSFHGPMNLGISEWSDEDISASADEAPIY